MILSGTGHRKLSDKYYPSKEWNGICAETVKILEDLNPSKILSGGAIGFDSLLIDAALVLAIPYVVVRPFVGQENAWVEKTRSRYEEYLTKAQDVITVSEGGYEPWKMQTRNEYLVNKCDTLLACYDPSRKGGTFNCIEYAKKVNRSIIYIDAKSIRKF
jgi:uncharacterized phage-like protein YoqJ